MSVLQVIAKEYYENNKKSLQKQVRKRYRSLSDEKKNKKENTKEIDTKICVKRWKRTKRIRNNVAYRQKSHDIKTLPFLVYSIKEWIKKIIIC